MVVKKLVICPNCETLGKKEVLGEMGADGSFTVLRFHKGETRIVSKDFSVTCGSCGEVVFFREVK